MDWKKFWPTMLPVLATLSTVFSDQLGVYLATHPTASMFAVTVVTALANATKSPMPPKPE